MRILIVEDDRRMAAALRRALDGADVGVAVKLITGDNPVVAAKVAGIRPGC